MKHPRLVLKRGEQRRIRAGHLWVFSNEVDTERSPLTEFTPGALATLCDQDLRPLGTAYVNPASLITARLLSRRADARIDSGWFTGRLQRALSLRQALVPGDCWRLVHGEGDGLPGLTVDRYGEHLVVQTTTAGMDCRTADIIAALEQTLAPASILLRNTVGVRELEGLPLDTRQAMGSTPEMAMLGEHGLSFRVPLHAGQKTGWFFDHRDNRARLAAPWIHGRRVLDVFAYLGAWSARAGALGAAEIAMVDSSEAALAIAADNVADAAPGVAAEIIAGDAFDSLEAMAGAGRQFDVVIVDPPAFIKRRRDSARGSRAYERLFRLALKLCAPEAMFIGASCSGLLGAAEFQGIVRRAALAEQRTVRIVARGGQAADHPVHPAVPESEYLKCLFCRVQA